MTKRITEEECRKLYEKYNTPSHVIGHCQAVSSVAVTLGKKLNECGYTLDVDLIKGAGLIHDVARVSEDHAKTGAEILEKLGFQDEANIVRVHMTYDFNSVENLNETDIVCLADRLVKEDKYVGLDERIDYLIHKPGCTPERTERILSKKKETKKYMLKLEKIMGQTIDSLFMKG